MKNRYKVRAHESGDQDGATSEGTIVLHLGGSIAIEAESMEAIEALVRKQVGNGKMAKGSVYQIAACAATGERARTLAVDLMGNIRDCRLDCAEGFYSEFRRIHYSASAPALAEAPSEMEVLAA